MDRDVYKWQYIKDGEVIAEDAFMHYDEHIAYQEAISDCKALLDARGTEQSGGNLRFTGSLTTNVYKWEYKSDGDVLLSDVVLCDNERAARSMAEEDCKTLLYMREGIDEDNIKINLSQV